MPLQPTLSTLDGYREWVESPITKELLKRLADRERDLRDEAATYTEDKGTQAVIAAWADGAKRAARMITEDPPEG